MLYRILTFAFGSLLAGGQTVVSVCNLASVPKSIVQHAQAEVVAVFARAGVTIEWLACDKPGQALVVRLRRARPAASTTEDQLGRAFLDPEGHGSLADVYFNPVREFASANEAETNAVLGYVIAHELGHLMFGPHHTHAGLMRARWRPADLHALAQHHFGFSKTETLARATLATSH